MTQEKMLEFLKAKKSLCEEFIAQTTDYIEGAGAIIKRSYLADLIEIIERYDNDEAIRRSIDAVIELANEVIDNG